MVTNKINTEAGNQQKTHGSSSGVVNKTDTEAVTIDDVFSINADEVLNADTLQIDESAITEASIDDW